MKKLFVFLTLSSFVAITALFTSCQKDDSLTTETAVALTQNDQTIPNDNIAADSRVAIQSLGVSWNTANQGYITRYITDCGAVTIGGNTAITLGGIQVREVTGISRINGTMSRVVVTTGVTSNFPNRVMIVEVATGNVIANIGAQINGVAVALKDIELGYYNNVTPIYYAIQAGTRRIVSVNIATGVCNILATVPGAGILHGLATTNTNRVYVIQTNSPSCIGFGLMWRYNVTAAFPTIVAAGNQNYIGTAAMMNGEGGLSYVFTCPNNPFQFANQAGVFSNATGPVGCAPVAALSVIGGVTQRFHDTTLYQ